MAEKPPSNAIHQPVADGNLGKLQQWLTEAGLDAIVVPSTDEYVSEFAPPANRRLRWATGFTGSTGVAVIQRRAAALFLDGRYRLQATEEVVSAIEVVGTSAHARLAWFKRSLPSGARLGVYLPVHGIADLASWKELAVELRMDLVSLQRHPVDSLWSDERPAAHRPIALEHPLQLAGADHLSKLRRLHEHIRTRALGGFLVADPEDVSWLLNVRAGGPDMRAKPGEWHIVPSVPSRVLVRRDGTADWFVEAALVEEGARRLREEAVRIVSPALLEAHLEQAAGLGPIAADSRRTPAHLAVLVAGGGGFVADDSVSRWRWLKNEAEVTAARLAHRADAVAIVKFMAWLARTVPCQQVTEYDAAVKLEALRSEHDSYDGASMPLMSASGCNGAKPHYVPTERQAHELGGHPIFWMDSGGHYRGGTTDNTLTLAVGQPAPKHRIAHTLVLKGFIALSACSFPVGTCGLQLDSIARQPLWREGVDYDHNTGHGVGAALNIHEGPSIGRAPTPTSTVALQPGMIVSNEPGYYAEGDYGLRIESHMLVVPGRRPGFLAFETISFLPIDPTLVDFERLDAGERAWLADYHMKILGAVGSRLERQDNEWLVGIVNIFIDAARDASPNRPAGAA